MHFADCYIRARKSIQTQVDLFVPGLGRLIFHANVVQVRTYTDTHHVVCPLSCEEWMSGRQVGMSPTFHAEDKNLCSVRDM